MKTVSPTAGFWNKYLKKTGIEVPNISFIRFVPWFFTSFILATLHSYSKFLVIDESKNLLTFFELFFSVQVPNTLFLILGIFFISRINKRFDSNNIPARVIILTFTAIGSLRGILVDFLQRDVEATDPFEYLFEIGRFVISLDIADFLNGIVLGISVAVGVIFYAIFIESELKSLTEISEKRHSLRVEIHEVESDLTKFERDIEKKIYIEVLTKIDLAGILKELHVKKSDINLERLLREKITEKLRSVSSEMIKPKKVLFGSKPLLKMRNFINSTDLILKPIWFAIASVSITLGNNASINVATNIQFLFVNGALCATIIFLFNRFLLSRMRRYYLNSDITLITAVALSLSSEIFAALQSYSLIIEFRIQRFVFFLFLINFISFIYNVLNTEENQNRNCAFIADMQEKLNYLDQSLKSMQREIAEHLHGYLIFRMSDMGSRFNGTAVTEEAMDVYIAEISESFSYENYSVLNKNFRLDIQALQQLSREWEGLMSVTFEGDLQRVELVPAVQKRELWNVIIELLNNAYRHGAASSIAINFDFSLKNFLQLCAKNDGSPISHYQNRGTGSQIFKVASDGHWSIRNLESGGVQVDITIQFYSASASELLID